MTRGQGQEPQDQQVQQDQQEPQDRFRKRTLRFLGRRFRYPRRRPDGRRRWAPSFLQVTALFASLLLLASGSFVVAVAVTPIPEPNEPVSAQTSIVYWNDGSTEIGRFGKMNRVDVELSQVPKYLQYAALAAEDRGFYDHPGFDPGSLVRAWWSNITGNATQGGSTIGQQYAKNAFLTSERSYGRKFRELLLSVKIDSSESKEEILEKYLNAVYFGRGAYGVDAAATVYFGKPVEKLNLRQSAVLAALIRAPGGYDPDVHRDRLKQRWSNVLDAMLTKQWITAEEREKARFPKIKKVDSKSSFEGPQGYLLSHVQNELLARGFSQEDLDVGGLRITTTFDQADQESAVQAVREAGPTSSTTGLHTGVASVEPGTGAIKALYGGDDYLKRQYSDATQVRSMAGSTFKTFALAAALEKGIKLSSTWNGNSPQNIRGYQLQNEANRSYGYVSLVEGLEKSINTVFVHIASEVGFKKIVDAAIRAGLPPETLGLEPGPTLVLGTASPTALQMANAYATFAADGIQAEPTSIAAVTKNGSDELLYEMAPKTSRAFSPKIAQAVTYALEHVVAEGTGTPARALSRPAGAKTGTTDGGLSAWFVGYTPQLSTAVMLQKSDKKGRLISLDGTGGLSSVYGASFPAAIWTQYMIGALDGEAVRSFTPPPDVPGAAGFMREFESSLEDERELSGTVVQANDPDDR